MRTSALLVCAALVSSTMAAIDIPIETVGPGVIIQSQIIDEELSEGGDPFLRLSNLDDAGDWPGAPWFFSPMISLVDLGVGVLDVSAPGTQLEFDVRYHQEGTYEGVIGRDTVQFDPYDARSCYLRLDAFFEPWNVYTFGEVVTAADAATTVNGDWLHVVVPFAGPQSESENFDVTKLFRLEFYGENYRVGSDDYLDLKNLAITPEPTSLGLLCVGLLGVLRRR